MLFFSKTQLIDVNVKTCRSDKTDKVTLSLNHVLNKDVNVAVQGDYNFKDGSKVRVVCSRLGTKTPVNA